MFVALLFCFGQCGQQLRQRETYQLPIADIQHTNQIYLGAVHPSTRPQSHTQDFHRSLPGNT